MSNSWSGLRKELEQDFICEKLKGRVQYFLTHYHNAPDDYGRICIRVDGKEVLHGNPYDYYVKGYSNLEYEVKEILNVPDREYTDKGYLYEVENKIIEDSIKNLSCKDGVFEIYDFTDAIYEYKNSDILDSLNSKNGLIRMLAIMDRRVGKRTLIKKAEQINQEPDWLKFFYKLRLDAENIRYNDVK